MALLHNRRAGLRSLALSGWSMAGLIANLMLAAITMHARSVLQCCKELLHA